MILVRFARTFRERAPEWVLAFIQTGWGSVLLLPGSSFDRPFFAPLASIASESIWGGSVTVAGLCRLAALFVNGSRQETPLVRQACSFFSMLFWAMLTMGCLSLDWRTPAIFTYAGLFVLEAIMFQYAGRDAALNTRKGAAGGAR